MIRRAPNHGLAGADARPRIRVPLESASVQVSTKQLVDSPGEVCAFVCHLAGGLYSQPLEWQGPYAPKTGQNFCIAAATSRGLTTLKIDTAQVSQSQPCT